MTTLREKLATMGLRTLPTWLDQKRHFVYADGAARPRFTGTIPEIWAWVRSQEPCECDQTPHPCPRHDFGDRAAVARVLQAQRDAKPVRACPSCGSVAAAAKHDHQVCAEGLAVLRARVGITKDTWPS